MEGPSNNVKLSNKMMRIKEQYIYICIYKDKKNNEEAEFMWVFKEERVIE